MDMFGSRGDRSYTLECCNLLTGLLQLSSDTCEFGFRILGRWGFRIFRGFAVTVVRVRRSGGIEGVGPFKIVGERRNEAACKRGGSWNRH